MLVRLRTSWSAYSQKQLWAVILLSEQSPEMLLEITRKRSSEFPCASSTPERNPSILICFLLSTTVYRTIRCPSCESEFDRIVDAERQKRDYVARNIIPLMLRRTLCCEAATRVAIDAGFRCPVSRQG